MEKWKNQVRFFHLSIFPTDKWKSGEIEKAGLIFPFVHFSNDKMEKWKNRKISSDFSIFQTIKWQMEKWKDQL